MLETSGCPSQASFHFFPALFVPRKAGLCELHEQGYSVIGQCKHQQEKDSRWEKSEVEVCIPPVPYLSVTRTECGQKPSLSLGCFLQRANHHLWVPLTIFSCWLFRTRGGNSSHVLLKLVHSLKKLIQFECAMSSSALTLSNVPSSHSK